MKTKIHLCDYGCGKEAKYYFKIVKKWCCSKHQNQCIEVKNQGKIGYPKGRKNQILSKIMKGKIPWNKGINGYHIHDDEFKKRAAEICKNRKFSDETREKLRKNITGDRNPSKRRDCREKIKQRMLNGGAAIANSANKSPSKPQVKLFELVQEIYPLSILNYPVKKLNLVLDIAIPEIKIWIESDGSYWHQDKEKDLERQKRIESLLGWKCIRYDIDSIKQIPPKERITKDILYLKDKR